jgi:hypothetical protein
MQDVDHVSTPFPLYGGKRNFGQEAATAHPGNIQVSTIAHLKEKEHEVQD